MGNLESNELGAKTTDTIDIASGLLINEGVQNTVEHGAEYMKTAGNLGNEKVEQAKDIVELRKVQTKEGIKDFLAQRLIQLQGKLSQSILKDKETVNEKQSKMMENDRIKENDIEPER